MYDVAIIGAGPGGSTAARYLAMNGLKVGLIDKAKFPRDKACGGAIPSKILNTFSYLKSRSREFIKCIGSRGYLHSPDRKTVLTGEIPLAMTLRSEFDNVLLEAAMEAGANTILGTRVKSIKFDKEKVTIDTKHSNSINARLIIGADGVNSIVARLTALNIKWPSGSLVACKVAEIPCSLSDIMHYYGDEHTYHFYSGSWNQIGYGWVFPKYDTVNIGLGIIDKAARGLPSKFKGFVKLLQKEGVLKPDVDLSSTKGALVPVSGPIKSTVCDRCLLIGDAAGMVNPLTGGGIDYAMQSGRIAAKTLIGAFEEERFDKSFLMKYQRIWKSRLGPEFRNQLLSQKIMTSAFSSTLFKIGSRDKEIQKMVTSAMADSLGKTLKAYRLVARAAYVSLKEVFNPFSS
jgi:geranylgeranyl reductase family protein